MAALKELRRLRDEERTLVNIASKVSDQLNRLKVEELALVSMIRLNASQGESVVEELSQYNIVDNSQVQQQVKTEPDMRELYEDKPSELLPLDLSVQPTAGRQSNEEEEEDEEEDVHIDTQMR